MDAISFMDDMGITNEHLKEHLMTLSMNKEVIDRFDKIDSQTKALFTRSFNKTHKNDLVGKKGGGKKGGAKDKGVTEGEEDIEDEDLDGSQLIDEDEMNEIKQQK